MPETRASAFAEALQQFEQDGDLDAFVRIFTDDAELLRPEQRSGQSGSAGAKAFWQAYLDQFETIGSTFGRLVDAERYAELEWVSEGTLRTGRDISYAGVSLLEHDDEGAVVRFATYYDTSAFTTSLH